LDSFDEYTTSSGEVFRLTSSLGDILAPERYFRAKAKAKRLEHGLEFLLLDCRFEYEGKYGYRSEPKQGNAKFYEALSNLRGIVGFVRTMDTQDLAQVEQLLDCLVEYLEPEPVRPSPLGLWLIPNEVWLLIADALSPLISAEFYNGLLGLGDGYPLDDE
jgi:hypothetical protein